MGKFFDRKLLLCEIKFCKFAHFDPPIRDNFFLFFLQKFLLLRYILDTFINFYL